MAKDVVKVCPYMGMKPCIQDGTYNIVTQQIEACEMWTFVKGKDPQGGEINQGGCAVAWVPILLIENANVARGVAASVQTLRNENVTIGQHITGALLEAANVKQGLIR